MRKSLTLCILCCAPLGCADDAPSQRGATGDPGSLAQLGDAGGDARAPSVHVDASLGAAAADGAVPHDAGRPMPPVDSADDPCALTTRAPAEALHAAAATVLTAQTPCGFSACHTGSRAKAGLRLSGLTDLRAELVDKPACEAPALPLVAGTGGADALRNSWLWLKLTRSEGPGGALPDEPSWGGFVNCGQSPAEPYGMLMPVGTDGLEPSELAPIRDWICAGAPGPQ